MIQCDQCQSILKYRSIDGTKVMSTHIKACKKKEKSDNNQHDAVADVSSESRMSKRIPEKLKKSITEACVELASLDNRPFETVRGDGFMILMEKMFLAGQQLSGSSGVQVSDLIPDPTTVVK
jgi:DNA-directed RNA polymerase subunit M/transcription elongation factor TFIIS